MARRQPRPPSAMKTATGASATRRRHVLLVVEGPATAPTTDKPCSESIRYRLGHDRLVFTCNVSWRGNGSPRRPGNRSVKPRPSWHRSMQHASRGVPWTTVRPDLSGQQRRPLDPPRPSWTGDVLASLGRRYVRPGALEATPEQTRREREYTEVRPPVRPVSLGKLKRLRSLEGTFRAVHRV